ncbi:unnamed protein product [Protopolystoma xenopodis]|uniref:Uncharacterized protein n=1 Tax=Protopolystoma xenopodis TaxID=117903 RepID=A0A3S5BXR2_9PLAT|nr:unnamed protein product [Protopolystoma xenopodis]
MVGFVPAPPSPKPLHGLGLLQLVSSVLLASAYIALCLHNPVEALHAAQTLLGNSLAPGYRQSETSGLDEVKDLCDVADTGSGPAYATSVNSATNIASAMPNTMQSASIVSIPDHGSCSSLLIVTPPAYRYLARMYLADALLWLDR